MKNYYKLTSLAAIALLANSAHAALVAYYQFEETADTGNSTAFADSSGNGYDGVADTEKNVDGDGGTLAVAGVVGSGYNVGGAGFPRYSHGIVTSGTTSFGVTGNNARTFSFWFNASSIGDSTAQNRLISIGASAAAESFDIVLESGQVGLRYGNGNAFYNADNSGTAFTTGNWYHLAVVYDGTTLDLNDAGTSDGTGLIFYANGVELNVAGGNSNNGAQALNTASSDFVLGARNDTTFGNYDGLLDEVQVYNEALSSSDVTFLYNNAGSPIPEPSAFALLAGMFGLTWVMLRRR